MVIRDFNLFRLLWDCHFSGDPLSDCLYNSENVGK